MRYIDADAFLKTVKERAYMIHCLVDCSFGTSFMGMTVSTITDIVDSMPSIDNTFEYLGFKVQAEWSPEDNAFYGMVKDGVQGYIEVRGETLDDFCEDFHEGVDDYLDFRRVLADTGNVSDDSSEFYGMTDDKNE